MSYSKSRGQLKQSSSTISLVSSSPAATADFAGQVANWAKDRDLITLQGEIGTGKTFFTKALAAALGIQEPVTSPTFGLVMEYQRPGQGWLYHLDLYRIASLEQACSFGIEEYLYIDHAITVVEWPERVKGLLQLPSGAAEGRLLPLQIHHAGSNRRRIVMPAEPGREILTGRRQAESRTE